MLKQYLRTMPKPKLVATREVAPLWYMPGLFAIPLLWYFAHNWYGVPIFVLWTIALASLNEARLKPRRPEERLDLESYAQARSLKSIMEHSNLAKRIEPKVLDALEAAASAYFLAMQPLMLLPAEMEQIRLAATESADATMRVAILAAKPFVRREDQSRNDFRSLSKDSRTITSVVERINAQTSKLERLEAEASKYAASTDVAHDLYEAMAERQQAEEELRQALSS